METTKICNKRPGVQLPSLNDVQACGRRIAGVVKRTPVVRLGTHLVKLNHQSVRVSRQKGSECSSDSASVSDSIRDVSGEIEVFLKLENEQHCGSVKSRSAASYLSALEQRADGDDALRRGVVTASTGNFGQVSEYVRVLVGARIMIAELIKLAPFCCVYRCLSIHTDQPPQSQSLDKTCRIPGFLSKSLDGTKTSEKELFPPKKRVRPYTAAVRTAQIDPVLEL